MTDTITINLRDLLREHLGSRFDVPAQVGLDDLLEFNAVEEEHPLDLDDLLAKRRAIALTWDTDHVRDRRPDLDDAQAWHVLEEARRSWDRLADPMLETIRQVADILYPPAREAKARLRDRLLGLVRQVEALPADERTNPADYGPLATKLDAVEAALAAKGGAR